MLASIAAFAQSLGAAFFLSELGAAELILSLLVAAGLIGCAVQGPDREHAHHPDHETHRHA
jgi:hypothetical protein